MIPHDLTNLSTVPQVSSPSSATPTEVVNGVTTHPEAGGDGPAAGTESSDLAPPSVLSAAASSEDLAPEDFIDAIDVVPTFFSTLPVK